MFNHLQAIVIVIQLSLVTLAMKLLMENRPTGFLHQSSFQVPLNNSLLDAHLSITDLLGNLCVRHSVWVVYFAL